MIRALLVALAACAVTPEPLSNRGGTHVPPIDAPHVVECEWRYYWLGTLLLGMGGECR